MGLRALSVYLDACTREENHQKTVEDYTAAMLWLTARGITGNKEIPQLRDYLPKPKAAKATEKTGDEIKGEIVNMIDKRLRKGDKGGDI